MSSAFEGIELGAWDVLRQVAAYFKGHVAIFRAVYYQGWYADGAQQWGNVHLGVRVKKTQDGFPGLSQASLDKLFHQGLKSGF
jgi:hypothetical protein